MFITPPTKIVVKESPIHGLGVFCTKKIETGEIVETCPFLVFPQSPLEKVPVFSDYSFCFPRSDNWTHHSIVLGYGSLYNHSEEPNTNWYTDDKTFVFFSLREIEVGEELLINYSNGIIF